jgi:hypothetical protein
VLLNIQPSHQQRQEESSYLNVSDRNDGVASNDDRQREPAPNLKDPLKVQQALISGTLA